MTTDLIATDRYRLEIKRAGEEFETHGFFVSMDLAEWIAEGDIVGCGDRMVSTWDGPDSRQHWVATSRGTTYRVTHEAGPVTTSPEYQAVIALSPQHVTTEA